MKYLRGFFGINYCSDGTFNVQLKEHFYGVLCFVVIKTVGKQAVVKTNHCAENNAYCLAIDAAGRFAVVAFRFDIRIPDGVKHPVFRIRNICRQKSVCFRYLLDGCQICQGGLITNQKRR